MNSAYFYNRNYVAIYLHNFFDALGKSLLEFFTAVLLYQIGMPIHFILLFFALKFGLMGTLSPLSIILTSRIGLNSTIFLSSCAYIIGAYLLVLGDYTRPVLLFSSLIFFAIKGALYHPLINGVLSMYVEDEHRGKVNSLNTILKIIAILISVALGSFLLISSHHLSVVLAIAGCLSASVLMYVIFLEKRPISMEYTFKEVFQYFFSKKFRNNIWPFSVQTFLILERIFIPLFIYIFFNDLMITAIIIGAAVFIELFALYFFGQQIDKFSDKSFFQSSCVRSISPLIFLGSYLLPPLIYVGQAYTRISDNIFTTSFNSKIQTKAKKNNDPILFIVTKEMTLCFSEQFFLLVLAAIALIIGGNVIPLIFIGSFISVWIMYTTWRD